MLIAILAGLEAMVVYASRSKQGRARRQQLLMGTSTDLHRAVPLVDNYLQQKTVKASKFQRFIASKLAALCRRLVQTRSFEFLVLHLVRAAIVKRRNRLHNMKRRITL
jgi:aspartyl/asparaginyl beta-hydroxylase (cupin superfamily)